MFHFHADAGKANSATKCDLLAEASIKEFIVFTFHESLASGAYWVINDDIFFSIIRSQQALPSLKMR